VNAMTFETPWKRYQSVDVHQLVHARGGLRIRMSELRLRQHAIQYRTIAAVSYSVKPPCSTLRGAADLGG